MLAGVSLDTASAQDREEPAASATDRGGQTIGCTAESAQATRPGSPPITSASSEHSKTQADDSGHSKDTATSCSRKWKLCIEMGLPQQQDASSCGVFMLAFADLLMQSLSPPFSISQADIAAMRLGIAAQLLNLGDSRKNL